MEIMKIGDKVRFLSEVGGGVVTGFRGKDIVLVEDADGFDIPMPVRECVVIETDDYNIPTPASKAAKKKAEEQSAARMASAASKPVSSVLDSGRQIECPVQTSGICLSSAGNERWRCAECVSCLCSGRYQGGKHYSV